EIYESEIVFYAFTNDLPFQTEQCPHMNEGIRTEIREFLNKLENTHAGIKNNMFRSVLKISQTMKTV
ncbi:MAG TPA: TIGR00269 family protein, partial [Candidatus Nitrosotenuis sp.]|nr:TIGR00269 family protein [Candidatus Nitrosotenuis sp.]